MLANRSIRVVLMVLVCIQVGPAHVALGIGKCLRSWQKREERKAWGSEQTIRGRE
jgi:hypothetical protein